MLLKGKLRYPPLVKLKRTNYRKTLIYLRVTIAEPMCMLPNLTDLRTRLINLMCMVRRRIMRYEWGLSRKAAESIYVGLFLHQKM